jgi:hypothetical protein
MAANRCSEPEHRPRRRPAAFWARLPFMDGAGRAGRWLATESLTEAVLIVSREVLEDGSEGRAKEIPKKTHEIFLEVSAASGG